MPRGNSHRPYPGGRLLDSISALVGPHGVSIMWVRETDWSITSLPIGRTGIPILGSDLEYATKLGSWVHPAHPDSP